MPTRLRRSGVTVYDYRHRQARREAARRHQPTDQCVRCGRPLGPMGPHLHYDHTADRTAYLGFAHGHCNTRAGAIKGNRERAHRPTRWASRAW